MSFVWRLGVGTPGLIKHEEETYASPTPPAPQPPPPATQSPIRQAAGVAEVISRIASSLPAPSPPLQPMQSVAADIARIIQHAPPPITTPQGVAANIQQILRTLPPPHTVVTPPLTHGQQVLSGLESVAQQFGRLLAEANQRERELSQQRVENTAQQLGAVLGEMVQGGHENTSQAHELQITSHQIPLLLPPSHEIAPLMATQNVRRPPIPILIR
mgnify:CR=1 FL=1